VKIYFKNGKIVLPDRVLEGTLIVENEKIVGISTADEGGEEGTVIDVRGKLLFPGMIDSHVHMWDPSPQNYREDWEHGSRCAASGGITTIVEMPLSVPPVTDTDSFENKRITAEAVSVVDFAFWGGLTPRCIDHLEEMDQLGCVAYKGFMSFANPDYPQITDGYLVEGMRRLAKVDGLVGVHAENAECADMGSKEMARKNGSDYARYDDEARPWWVEYEAIQRACLFSKVTGCRLLINHMTIAEGAELLKKEKLTNPRLYVETCPHYLLYTHDDYNRCGTYAKCNPPLRSPENVEKMWNYIFDGTIDVIGTDHGPYSDEEKEAGSFWTGLPGFGGYDAAFAGLLTEGVHKRGLPPERLAALTSGNTAKILGLFPRKGSLLPGADADIAIVDPNLEWIFDGNKSFSKTKSTKGLFHGAHMHGKVVATYVRGQQVYDGKCITAEKGYGHLIRKIK